MKEKYEKDIIIIKCKDIIKMLNEIIEEENETNEGYLKMYYNKIKENIINIVEERIKYISFWEEK